MLVEIINSPRFLRSEMNLGMKEIGLSHLSISTSLASCISIILYSELDKIGGMSHITGFGDEKYLFPYAKNVLDKYNELINELNIRKPNYYIVGGIDNGLNNSFNTIRVLKETMLELDKRKIKSELLDVGGSMYRSVLFDIKTPLITIHKYSPGIRLIQDELKDLELKIA